MKIHTFKSILTIVAIGGLAMIALTRITAGFLPGMAVVVSYTTATILLAIAAMDYRLGSKD